MAWLAPFSSLTTRNAEGFWQLTLPEGITMVHIPAGEFPMGALPNEKGAELPTK